MTRLILITLAASLFTSGIYAQDVQPSHFNGEVTRSFTEPIETSVVAASVVGVIEKVNIVEGAKVSAGDELAVISHGVLLAEKTIAETRVESDAELKVAKSNLQMKQDRKETVESLISSGHVNQFEIQERISEYQNALAQFHSAEHMQKLNRLQIKRIEAQINDRIIRSPINGFVTQIHKNIGEHVSSSEPQFATVVRLDELKVRFYLTEETLDRLTPQSKVTVEVGRNHELKIARVIFISPTINPDSGTGSVDVVVPNADLKIRSGTVCHWRTESKQPQR